MFRWWNLLFPMPVKFNHNHESGTIIITFIPLYQVLLRFFPKIGTVVPSNDTPCAD